MQSRSFHARSFLLMFMVVCASSTLVAQGVVPGGGKPGEQNSTPSPGAGNLPPQRSGGPGPGGPPEPFPEAKSIPQPKNDRELAAAIKQLAGEVASTDRFSGSVLVAADGDILLDDAWGDAVREHHIANMAETAFDVGSVGKLCTQIAILQLAEAHKLTLDAPFGKYLTKYPDQDIAAQVTIRQLLLHTSGMGDFFDAVTPDTHLGFVRELKSFLPLFSGKPLEFAPGSATRYSNTGYIVLGMVIEAVSGEDYFTYAERHILQPAGMTHSGFFDRSHLPATVAHSYDDHRDVTGTYAAKGSPAGGMQATASDLLKLVQSINADKLMSQESVKILRGLIPHPPNTPPPADETKLTGYGIGGGAPGVSAQLVVDPTGRYTWVVLCNGSPPMAMSMGTTIRQWVKGMSR